MKKIIVLTIYNTKNNGSAMMGINAIDFYHHYFKKDVKFYCDFETKEDQDRILLESEGDIKVEILNLPKFHRGKNIYTSIKNRIIWLNNIISHIKKYNIDAIIVLGGDDFSEYYSGFKIVMRLYIMYRLSLNFPVYLIGHTIGPFKSWRKKAFEVLMKRCRIITRDRLSLDHCQNDLNHNHTIQGHDLAWFNLPKQSQELQDKMLQKYNLFDKKYITITPSALVSHYTNNDEDYYGTFKKIIEGLLEQDYYIVLMPHVFSDKKFDDVNAIKEIKKRIFHNNEILFIEEELLPSECRAIVSKGYMTISCRMHSAVSTLQTSTPVIALSYSAKYSGVIGQDIGMPELIIESRNNKLWKYVITNKVLEKVKYISADYENIKKQISIRVKSIQENETKILANCGDSIEKNKGRLFLD